MFPLFVQEDDTQENLLFRRMTLPSEKDKAQRLLCAADQLQALPAVQWYQMQMQGTDVPPLHVQGSNTPFVSWPLVSPVETHIRVMTRYPLGHPSASWCYQTFYDGHNGIHLMATTHLGLRCGLLLNEMSPFSIVAHLRRGIPASPDMGTSSVMSRHVRLSQLCEAAVFHGTSYCKRKTSCVQ